jgi:hypothetical protein
MPMPMSMPMYMFIVYRLSFFAYRTLASYYMYNGLLCHMRALSHAFYRIHSSTVAPTTVWLRIFKKSRKGNFHSENFNSVTVGAFTVDDGDGGSLAFGPLKA